MLILFIIINWLPVIALGMYSYRKFGRIYPEEYKWNFIPFYLSGITGVLLFGMLMGIFITWMGTIGTIKNYNKKYHRSGLSNLFKD